MTKKEQFNSVTLDFEKMSAIDIFDFEEHSGGVDLQSFVDQLKAGNVNEDNYIKYLRPLVALIWVNARRDHPGLTYEDVAAQPLVPLFGAIKAPDDAPVAPLTPLEPRMTAAERRAARSAATSNAKK